MIDKSHQHPRREWSGQSGNGDQLPISPPERMKWADLLTEQFFLGSTLGLGYRIKFTSTLLGDRQ